MPLPARVTVVEVGPRDGLQNEPGVIAVEDKIAFIEGLAAAGAAVVEAASFVNPAWVPQMADAEQVLSGIRRQPGVRYPVLVPNVTGLERALAAGAEDIAIFAAASETFSQRNLHRTIDESLESYRKVSSRAIAAGLRVRAYLSTAFGCPFEGPVAPDRVAAVAAALIAMGASEVAVSDTIGVAHPGQVPEVVDAVASRIPIERLALHFHDTRGTALANVLTALHLGVSTFDASAGGLGGCPYAPGATGNLASEDLVYMLRGLDIETGIDLDRLVEASAFIESRLGHPLPSRYYRAERARA